MRRLQSSISAACLLALPRVAANAQTGNDAIARVVDSVFAKDLAAKRFTGAAFVFVRDSTIAFAHGYGQSDPATHASVDPARTIFRVASISKVFAATAAMQLVEQGRLDLDANIDTYLTRFHVSDRARGVVTAASLLTHTSGLENRSMGSIARDSTDRVPLADYFARRPPRLDAVPGTQFAYSNSGVGLAGYLVEVISGESFDDYAEHHILRPLGMTSSSFRQPVPPELMARTAGAQRMRRAPLFNPYPAGSLMATPLDMGRFAIAHLNGGRLGPTRILAETTMAAMHRTRWTANGGAPGVTIGLFEARLSGVRILFHTGDSGHHGILFLLPDQHVGFYAVYDSGDESHAMMERLARAVVEQLMPGATREPPTPAPPSGFSHRARAFVGRYGANGIDPHTIEKAAGLLQQVSVTDNGDGRLRITPPGAPPITATEIAPRLFRGSDGAWIAFQRAAPGEGPMDGFTATGFLSDPFGAHRLRWYADSRLHLAIYVLGALAIVGRLAAGFAFRRRRRRGRTATMPRLTNSAWRVSGGLAICALLAPLCAAASAVVLHPPVVTLPAPAYLGILILTLAAVLSLALPPLAVGVFRERAWSLASRLAFAAFSIALVSVALSLAYWHLLALG